MALWFPFVNGERRKNPAVSWPAGMCPAGHETAGFFLFTENVPLKRKDFLPDCVNYDGSFIYFLYYIRDVFWPSRCTRGRRRRSG